MAERNTREDLPQEAADIERQQQIRTLEARIERAQLASQELTRIHNMMQSTMALIRGDNGPPLPSAQRAEALEVIDQLADMAARFHRTTSDTSSQSESSVSSEDNGERDIDGEESDIESHSNSDDESYDYQAFMTDAEWNGLEPAGREARLERFERALENWDSDGDESDKDIDSEQTYPGTEVSVLAAVPARSYLSRAEMRAWLRNELDEEERAELLQRIQQ